MNKKGFIFKVDEIGEYKKGAIEEIAKDVAKELDIDSLEKMIEYITGEEVNKSCEDFNNGYRTALYRVMSLVENQQQELERYKNNIKETIEKSRCIFEDKTINDDEAFYQLGCVIDKLENVIGGETNE